MLTRRTFLIASAMPLLAAPRKPMIVILLGPPGGGKGTQAEKIVAEFKIPAVSTGDLLRAEAKADTPRGREIAAVMKKGELVKDEIVNQLVADRMSKDDAKGGIILDGYPRKVSQAQFLDRLLKQRKLPKPVVINLDVPDEEIVKRLSARGRADDKPETVRERLRVYAQETKPLLEYYRKTVKSLDGTGTPEEVYERVRKVLR